jgi:phosphoglycolate phosphatase-like HAD superfamily hydrolase
LKIVHSSTLISRIVSRCCRFSSSSRSWAEDVMIYGFDFDGTLVTSWTATPLPNARERLAALPHGARTFVATNQGGPAFRAVLGDAKYPTVADVVARLRDGFRALGWRPDLLLVCCCAGRRTSARYWRVEAAAAADFDAQLKDALPGVRCLTYMNSSYRKPKPGMLHAARGEGLAHSRDSMVYIGDMESDQAAAEAAGAQYVDVQAWLSGQAPVE